MARVLASCSVLRSSHTNVPSHSTSNASFFFKTLLNALMLAIMRATQSQCDGLVKFKLGLYVLLNFLKSTCHLSSTFRSSPARSLWNAWEVLFF